MALSQDHFCNMDLKFTRKSDYFMMREMNDINMILNQLFLFDDNDRRDLLVPCDICQQEIQVRLVVPFNQIHICYTCLQNHNYPFCFNSNDHRDWLTTCYICQREIQVRLVVPFNQNQICYTCLQNQ